MTSNLKIFGRQYKINEVKMKRYNKAFWAVYRNVKNKYPQWSRQKQAIAARKILLKQIGGGVQ